MANYTRHHLPIPIPQCEAKGSRGLYMLFQVHMGVTSLICTAIYHALPEVMSAQGRWPIPA